MYAGGTRVYYDTDYSSDVIAVAADIRLFIFFFDASAGIIRGSKITVESFCRKTMHYIYGNLLILTIHGISDDILNTQLMLILLGDTTLPNYAPLNHNSNYHDKL